MRYFIDSFGYLWSGPLEPHGQYGRFNGLMYGVPAWTLECLKSPEDSEEITAAKANEIIQRFRDEAINEAFKQRVEEISGG